MADDRAVKRVVALIVANKGNKERKSTETDRDHQSPFKCYLFESEKYAEEIVRTIGQAFDLGYRNFLASDKPEMQIKSQLKQMSLKIKQLEGLNDQYSQRIALLESILKFNKIDFPKSSLVAKVSSTFISLSCYSLVFYHQRCRGYYVEQSSEQISCVLKHC